MYIAGKSGWYCILECRLPKLKQRECFNFKYDGVTCSVSVFLSFLRCTRIIYCLTVCFFLILLWLTGRWLQVQTCCRAAFSSFTCVLLLSESSSPWETTHSNLHTEYYQIGCEMKTFISEFWPSHNSSFFSHDFIIFSLNLIKLLMTFF